MHDLVCESAEDFNELIVLGVVQHAITKLVHPMGICLLMTKEDMNARNAHVSVYNAMVQHV